MSPPMVISVSIPANRTTTMVVHNSIPKIQIGSPYRSRSSTSAGTSLSGRTSRSSGTSETPQPYASPQWCHCDDRNNSLMPCLLLQQEIQGHHDSERRRNVEKPSTEDRSSLDGGSHNVGRSADEHYTEKSYREYSRPIS